MKSSFKNINSQSQQSGGGDARSKQTNIADVCKDIASAEFVAGRDERQKTRELAMA